MKFSHVWAFAFVLWIGMSPVIAQQSVRLQFEIARDGSTVARPEVSSNLGSASSLVIDGVGEIEFTRLCAARISLSHSRFGRLANSCNHRSWLPRVSRAPSLEIGHARRVLQAHGRLGSIERHNKRKTGSRPSSTDRRATSHATSPAFPRRCPRRNVTGGVRPAEGLRTR